jgi:hypothetical protein
MEVVMLRQLLLGRSVSQTPSKRFAKWYTNADLQKIRKKSLAQLIAAQGLI